MGIRKGLGPCNSQLCAEALQRDRRCCAGESGHLCKIRVGMMILKDAMDGKGRDNRRCKKSRRWRGRLLLQKKKGTMHHLCIQADQK